MLILKAEVTILGSDIASMMVDIVGNASWFGCVVGKVDYSSAKTYEDPNVSFDVMVDDPDGEEGQYSLRKTINAETLRHGVGLFADHNLGALGDLLQDEADFDTADAFWQTIIFGEVIYA